MQQTSSPQEKTKTSSNYRNITCSGLATLFAELITFPLCTLNTRYLASGIVDETSGKRIYQTIPTVFQIMKKEGYKSFYRGLPLAASGQVLSTATKYALTEGMYGSMRRHGYLSSKSTSDTTDDKIKRILLLNAIPSVGSIISTIITHPFDWMKIECQKQMKQGNGNGNVYTCTIYRNMFNQIQSNPRIVYRGWTKSVLKAGVGGILWFGLYFTLTEEFKYSPMVASAITGITAPILGGCLNTLKVQRTAGINNDTGKRIPLRELYRGNSLNFARVMPHFIITMTLTDIFKTYF